MYYCHISVPVLIRHFILSTHLQVPRRLYYSTCKCWTSLMSKQKRLTVEFANFVPSILSSKHSPTRFVYSDFRTALLVFWRTDFFFCLPVPKCVHFVAMAALLNSQPPSDSYFRALYGIQVMNLVELSPLKQHHLPVRIINSLFSHQLIYIRDCPLCHEYLVLCEKLENGSACDF